jgi:predicted dehydrogenase
MPLTVALCGLGSAAQRAHMPALLDAEEAGTAAIVGVCDPDPARWQSIDPVRGAGAYLDVVDVLDATRPDLLVIASPPSAHLAAIEAAALRDVDVLCEKPLGIGPGDAAELRQLAERHPDLLLATVHQYHHAPAWQRIAAAVGACIAEDRSFTLSIEVERPGTDPLSAGGWRARGQVEGGILGDHAVHYLAMCWLLDPDTTLLSCNRTGEPGRETANVALRLGRTGTASIRVSYAGAARHNFVAASTPDGSLDLRWADGELTSSTADGFVERVSVGALSDRQFVNDLYRALYADLVGHRLVPEWRAARTAETLGVADLLTACIAA